MNVAAYVQGPSTVHSRTLWLFFPFLSLVMFGCNNSPPFPPYYVIRAYLECGVCSHCGWWESWASTLRTQECLCVKAQSVCCLPPGRTVGTFIDQGWSSFHQRGQSLFGSTSILIKSTRKAKYWMTYTCYGKKDVQFRHICKNWTYFHLRLIGRTFHVTSALPT